MKLKYFFAAVYTLIANALTAQTYNHQNWCSSTEMYNNAVHQHPELLEERNQLEEFTQSYVENTENMPPVYIIPVVFHVIHMYGSENISETQINDQMRILNEDYRMLNPDISQVISQFQGITADCEIEFRLARKDPNGNCHTGIDRIVSNETYIGDDGSKLNPWPRNKYLNIWVVKTISSGAAGYAYLPGGAPSAAVDGIIILSTYVGSIGTGNPTTSRALTHEVGHFLNLLHTWGNGNTPALQTNCNGDDLVTDTPNTIGWTSCNLNGTTCNSLDNVQNYMDYSYCYRMFTQGQRTRMRAALNSTVGQRSSLWTTTNLAATGTDGSMNSTVCAPIADYIATYTYACVGSNFIYKNYNWGGHATSYNWSFPGGTPTTSTDSAPTIQYNSIGTYSSTMTVTNGTGTNSKTRTNYITTFSPTAQYSSWQYFEGFESGSIPNNDWTVINAQSYAWTVTNTAYYSGGNSARLQNTVANAGQIDEFFGPSVNFSSIQSPVMTFYVAFAQRTTSDNDKLRVLISTDCGKTWTPRYTKSGSNLATVNATNNVFVPNMPTQWRMETVSIGPYTSATNVRFKFEFTGDGGNNIYIDDINITGASSVGEEFENSVGMTLYPNPTDANATLQFTMPTTEKISVHILDITGRIIDEVYNGDMISGEQQLLLPVENLTKGIYLVQLNIGSRIISRKLVIN